MPLAIALVIATIAAVALWGPVARGLHEESVTRWCTQSISMAGAPVDDVAVSMCVNDALSDPSYLQALRASL